MRENYLFHYKRGEKHVFVPTPECGLLGDLLGLPAEKVRETLANYDLRTLGSMTEHELSEAGLTPTRARRRVATVGLAGTVAT